MARARGDGAGAATIAVLPFENLSTDPEQEYFARGFVEDLSLELARFPTLEVVHPQTAFALGADAREGETAPAPPLDVAYLLRGTVRRVGVTLRITARLLEHGSGRQLWAERWDAPAAEVLAVQDDITARVAGALAIGIEADRLGRAQRKPPASLAAYDWWLRGMAQLRGGTLADDDRARELFEQALAVDPTYARAHAGVALSHFNEWSCQAWVYWDQKERLAYEAAERAVALDDSDALVHIVLARIHLMRRAFDAADVHVNRALELNPNEADVLAQAALIRAYLGDGTGGIALARKALRLNPLHDPWYLGCLALPLFIVRDAREGIAVAGRFPRATVDLPAYLASGYARLGDGAQAAAHLGMFRADFEERITFGRTPDPGEPLRWLLHVNPFKRGEDAEYLAEGMRLAGLPPDPDESRRARRSGDPGAPPADDTPAGRAAAAEPAAPCLFRRTGDRWTMRFAGLVVDLSEVKGFHDLAVLLARPGEALHCLELAGRPAEGGGTDAVLDLRGRREVQGRIRELQGDLDDAEAAHDLGRSARARTELDRLVDALGKALGIGGRARQLGSPSERARSAVTWRIRSAIRKIATSHPRLGRHLENAVRTGTYCVYAPESPVDWQT